MGKWGVASTATPKEKIKSEMADFLNGLNSVGEISYKTYCEIFDFSMSSLDKMYELKKGEKLVSENLIYKNFAIEILDKMLDEFNEDGWCRLVMKKEDVLRFKERLKLK